MANAFRKSHSMFWSVARRYLKNMQTGMMVMVGYVLTNIDIDIDMFHAPFPAKVIEILQPALAIYENVKTAAERCTDKSGKVHEPCVEARYW